MDCSQHELQVRSLTLCVSGAAPTTESTIRNLLRGLRCTHLLCVYCYISRAVALRRPPSLHSLLLHWPALCPEPNCAGEALRGGNSQRYFRSTYNAPYQRARGVHSNNNKQPVSRAPLHTVVRPHRNHKATLLLHSNNVETVAA